MSFFGGGGGFPFGFGGMGHDDDDDEYDQSVDNQKYYEVLGVKKSATDDEIKKNYKDLAKKLHPDRKGGDVKKFQQLNEAYQTLSDPDKRRAYDKYGSKGGPQENDLLNMFFGGGRGGKGGAPGRRQLPKCKPTQKLLNITLEDIYNGKIIKMDHTRTRCCQGCKGKGGQDVQKCKTCKGKGIVVQMYQMGPGMYQQVQKHCDKCKGEGEIIAQGAKCKQCVGKKTLEKTKIIQVPIEKGTPSNKQISMPGQGNELPDTLAGDLVLITQQQPHQVFSRKGADLFMKKQVTLLQALTGFEFVLIHLDGHEYTIYTKKGEIISDNSKKVVRGLGMPFYKDPLSHGNLIIDFKILMPKRGTLNAAQLEQLAKILPGKVNARPENDKYEMLDDFRKQDTNTSQKGGHKQDQEQQLQQQQQAGGQQCRTQ